MKKIIGLVLLSTLVFAISSCNGNKTQSNPEADSLRNVINGNMAEMDEMNLFLDAVNASMDSVVNMEGDILRTQGESPKSKKAQILDNIEAYKMILQRQHDRLAILEQKLKNGDAQSQKMLKTIESLRKQIEEKDLAIEQLVAELDKRNFDIETLKTHVETLNTHVAELNETNRAQEEALEAQTDIMNEAYYFIGSKNELKEAGLLTGGSLFKKSKLDMKSVREGVFKKIDIRKHKVFHIPAKKAELLTQAPAGSYELVTNADGTSTLTITDPGKFWSISNYLIVRY